MGAGPSLDPPQLVSRGPLELRGAAVFEFGRTTVRGICDSFAMHCCSSKFEYRLSFGVLQYSNLDEQQCMAKLSQMPRGMKLYFQIWKPGQISPPVSMEKQEAVFQVLRRHAAQFGVTIEEKSDL